MLAYVPAGQVDAVSQTDRSWDARRWKVPLGQLSQIRSLVALGACVCRCPAPHNCHATHTVSALAPHASLAQLPLLHGVQAWHTLPTSFAPALFQCPAGHVGSHVRDGVRYRSPSHEMHASAPPARQLAHVLWQAAHRPVLGSAYCPAGQFDTHRPCDSARPSTHDRHAPSDASLHRRHVAWQAAHTGLVLPPHLPCSHSPVAAQSSRRRQARHVWSLLLLAATATYDTSSHGVTALQLLCPAASW